MDTSFGFHQIYVLHLKIIATPSPTSHCMFHEWCPVLRGYTPVISVSIPVSCPVSPEDYFTIPIVCIPLVTLLGFKYTYINIY